MNDAREYSASVARNRDPIWSVLQRVLPAQGLVLEVASGTGEHAVYFAKQRASLSWQPADLGPSFPSIEAWIEHERCHNVLPPVHFDLLSDPAPIDHADAIVSINTIHIAPWPATAKLFEAAAKILAPGGPVVLYGPFRYRDRPLEPSNEAFDARLRERYPGGGLRTFEDIAEIAEEAGFQWVEDVSMPANNHVLVWRR